MLHIDGSEGEGGGQVLRTSLALSALTGRPFHIDRLRAGRDRPGLQRQHLTGVRAVAAVCGATVTGDTLASPSLTFVPGAIRPGSYRFDVGTAGSLGLVLQAVLPVLWSANAPSSLELIGGTLNDRSPPAPFLQRTLLPLLGVLGPKVTLTVERHGFYPEGGGRYAVQVEPAPLAPLRLPNRGPIERIVAVAVVSRLPRTVGERELRAIGRRVRLSESRVEEVEASGPGNAVWIEAHTARVTEVFTGFGRRGTPAEKVAEEAAREYLEWEAIGAPVGPHLADQLLLPLALAGAGSFRTGPLTRHATTNLSVIRRFLEVTFEVEPVGGQVSVSLTRSGAG